MKTLMQFVLIFIGIMLGIAFTLLGFANGTLRLEKSCEERAKEAAKELGLPFYSLKHCVPPKKLK